MFGQLPGIQLKNNKESGKDPSDCGGASPTFHRELKQTCTHQATHPHGANPKRICAHGKKQHARLGDGLPQVGASAVQGSRAGPRQVDVEILRLASLYSNDELGSTRLECFSLSLSRSLSLSLSFTFCPSLSLSPSLSLEIGTTE